MNLSARYSRIYLCASLLLGVGSGFAGETQGVLHWANRASLSVPISGVVSEVLVSAGQSIKQGQVMVRLDTRRMKARIQAARAHVLRFQPGRDEAQRELQRARELFDRTVLSEVELQQAVIDFAEKDAELQAARADVVEATLNLEYSELKAPFDLQVLDVHAIHGQAVVNQLQAMPLVDVAENSLAVIAFMPPIKLDGARAGTQVNVVYAGKQLNGVISSIDYDVDMQRSVLQIALNDQTAVRGAVGHPVQVTWQ